MIRNIIMPYKLEEMQSKLEKQKEDSAAQMGFLTLYLKLPLYWLKRLFGGKDGSKGRGN